MEVGKLSVAFRPELRKSAVRRLRATGQIPAVCYGAGVDPMTLSVDPTLLLKSLDPIKKTNTVIEMTVSGLPDGEQKLTVMVREVQKDMLRGNLTHADFIRVSLDKEVHAVIPVVLTGKAEGVKLGGILHQVIRDLPIAALPHKIPIKLEVDVTNLGMGDAIHVSDLKFGEGVRALLAPGTSVCSVTAPKAEKVETPVVAEGAAAEGAAAAAPGAEGAAAAPAAGGKPGEKAPAAAAGGAKGGGKDDKKK